MSIGDRARRSAADRGRRAHVGRDDVATYATRAVPPGDRDARRAVHRPRGHGRSPTPRRARRWSGSPTSRPRCGGSRRWSRRGAAPPTVSTRWPRRWSSCSAPTQAMLLRYEADGRGHRGRAPRLRDVRAAVGTPKAIEGESVTALVRRTGRAARVEDYQRRTGPSRTYTRDAGIGSAVGARSSSTGGSGA